jgi:hypothetical protein
MIVFFIRGIGEVDVHLIAILSVNAITNIALHFTSLNYFSDPARNRLKADSRRGYSFRSSLAGTLLEMGWSRFQRVVGTVAKDKNDTTRGWLLFGIISKGEVRRRSAQVQKRRPRLLPPPTFPPLVILRLRIIERVLEEFGVQVGHSGRGEAMALDEIKSRSEPWSEYCESFATIYAFSCHEHVQISRFLLPQTDFTH